MLIVVLSTLLVRCASFIDLIPFDIQTQHIWPCFGRKDRRKMRELCKRSNGIYEELSFEEHSELQAYYNLSTFVSEINPMTDELAATLHEFMHKLTRLKSRDHFNANSKQNVFFIEKIVYKIISNTNLCPFGHGPSRRHGFFGQFNHIMATNLVLFTINKLNITIDDHDELWLMQDIITSFPHCFDQLQSINKLLDFGLREMNATSSKYNRYTKYALFQLELFFNLDLVPWKVKAYDCCVRFAWNSIVSVEFIEDYLQQKN